MRPIIYITILVPAICIALILTVREDPDRINPISTDAEPLVLHVLPATEAITLAQTHSGSPLLVTDLSGGRISAVDLTAYGAPLGTDLFDVFDVMGETRLQGLFMQANHDEGPGISTTYTIDRLASAAGDGVRHLSSGTNFPEHAEETNSQSVFAFPKFGPASPPVTTVASQDGMLLDYEVELCARFDRDIATVGDFEAARKGFFLCADFTDRAVLARMVDLDNFNSGSGFSDAKSGPDFFPTGAFLVVPNDWEQFVNAERFTTHRGDLLRQDARGGEMILDFRQLVEKALGDTTSTRFIYRGARRHLLADGRLLRGQAIMSGTPEGVIFMPPTMMQMARGVLHHLFSGAVLTGRSGYESVVDAFIQEELAAGRFLQAGERIRYASRSMGTISITVVDSQQSNPSPAVKNQSLGARSQVARSSTSHLTSNTAARD